MVAAAEPLVEIGDPTDLEVIVDFLSADAVGISPGQAVIIEGWEGEQALTGRVRLVEPFGYTKISALGIEEQRVNVTIYFPGSVADRARLGYGYQVEAKVVLWQSDAVLRVPLTALFRADENWAVFVLRNGRAEQQMADIRHRNGFEAEILSGLNTGDRVVTHLSNRLFDGVRIAQRNES